MTDDEDLLTRYDRVSDTELETTRRRDRHLPVGRAGTKNGDVMTTRAEQDVEMTARLYDCRSAARGILGPSYVATLRPWREFVARVMDAKKLSVLQAVLDIGKHIDPSDGTALMLVMAAGVEMIESPLAVVRSGADDGSAR